MNEEIYTALVQFLSKGSEVDLKNDLEWIQFETSSGLKVFQSVAINILSNIREHCSQYHF